LLRNPTLRICTKKTSQKRQQAKKLALLLCLFFSTTRATVMKNKSFYFWWKIHASATSFSTKNKTIASSTVLKVDDLETGKSEGNRRLLK
jgi:hypothetical protein